MFPISELAGIDPSTMALACGTVPPTLEAPRLAIVDGAVMPLTDGLVMPLTVGLVVLPAAVGGRDDDDDEVGRAPVAVGLGIWLGPEAVEPEGAIEELVGAEPAAGAVTVPIPAGVGAGDDREPLLGTDPGPGPASIWAAGVDEVWLGAAVTG